MGAGDSALENLSWAMFVDGLGGAAATKIRGIIQSAVRLGPGDFFVTLTQSLPIGEYLAAGQNLAVGPPSIATVAFTDGDATHKFVFSAIGGVASDFAFCAWMSRAFSN